MRLVVALAEDVDSSQGIFVLIQGETVIEPVLK
jgi:hypothetical protein